MKTNIRKWGNSAGTIIPAPVLAKAGLALGSAVDIEAEHGRIVIKLAKPTYTLDELLSLSPSGVVTKDDDDREWLSDPAVGQESS